MRSSFFVLALLLCATAAQAEEAPASSVWAWRSETGTLSFAGALDYVPARYRDQAKQVEWKAVETATEKHWTPVPSSEKYVQGLRGYLEISRKIQVESSEEICDSIPSARLVRQQDGVYSREIWIFTDACGRESFRAY